jgi:hypothetical protein
MWEECFGETPKPTRGTRALPEVLIAPSLIGVIRVISGFPPLPK